MVSRDIFDLKFKELTEFVLSVNEKKFRAKQIYEWVHNRPITSYDDMLNVPKTLRIHLQDAFSLDELKIEEILISKDGTRKFLFRCEDGSLVESVLISNDDGRLTACLSSQVGCAMQCAFCATGNQGFSRNLSSQEICFQLAHMMKDEDERVDNVVIMGQGEPFLNYDNTTKAIKRINHDDAFKIAARKITVSTCGIVEGINKFSEEQEQFGLAVSLHSAVQETRDFLIPKMKNMPLKLILEVLKNYQIISNRRMTLEYMLLDGINDSKEHCRELIEFCKQLMCHVNLLHFNTVEGCNLKPSSAQKFKTFSNALAAEGIACSERKSKGEDISGACGQLSSKFL